VTNPILAKSPAFAAQPTYQAPPAAPYPGYAPPGYPQGYQGYPPPGYQPGYPGYQPVAPEPTWQAPGPEPTDQKVMTLDDVLTKTGLTLGSTIIVAILAVWAVRAFQVPIAAFATAGFVCGLAVIIVPIIVATRRRVGPGLAMVFAVLEGVFLGTISLIFELVYPGIVIQAVFATFVAAALTLVAFRFGKFRLSTRMRKVVMMSVFAYAAVALINLVLYFFGINLGLFPGPYGPVSVWAWLIAGVGVVLAVLSLVNDFQFVEQGIANRAPATESWRAAYGLTVTLVWLYLNLLRILSYLRR